MPLLVLTALLLLTGTARAEELPPVTAKSLSGAEMTLPQDLPGDPALLLVGFTQAHDAPLRSWVTGLDLTADGAPPFVQLLAIGRRWALLSGAVDGVVRKDIGDAALQRITLTYYGDQRPIAAALGANGTDAALIAVVRPTGEILAVASGEHTPANARTIGDALGAARPMSGE